MVSEMVYVDPETARRNKYVDHSWGVVVPARPRPATLDEVQAIVATEETERKIQLLEMPAELADFALRTCKVRGADEKIPYPFTYEEIIPGFKGQILEMREDQPGALTTSRHDRKIHELSGERRFTGVHIDAYSEAVSTFIAAIKAAKPEKESWRYHLISTLSHLAIEAPAPKLYHQYLAAHIYRARFRPLKERRPFTYWLKQSGPRRNRKGRWVVEVVAGSPAAEFVHDGSLLDSPQALTTIVGAAEEIVPGTFPSLV